MASVVVNDLSFKYRDAQKYTLKHISFEAQDGAFIGIIGANGSGKSTLCNALVGLIPHYFQGSMRGSICIDGADTQTQSIAELSEHIGIVFQNPFNQLSYTAQTVAEELAFGLGNRGVSREDMQTRITTIAHLMRLDGLLDRNPLELSGGQVQRVALGSTLIMDPDILVLDECTTQLDPLGSEEIFSIVKELNAAGMTVLVVDHDMERLARYASELLVLDKGEIIARGTPEEVFGRDDLEQHGADIPEYVRLSRALAQAHVGTEQICLTEEASIAQVREVLGRDH